MSHEERQKMVRLDDLIELEAEVDFEPSFNPFVDPLDVFRGSVVPPPPVSFQSDSASSVERRRATTDD